MRALDSNILLRYITQDDSAQTPVATHFVENQLTVPIQAMSRYQCYARRYGRFGAPTASLATRCGPPIGRLLSSAVMVVADSAVVEAALTAEGEIVDALIHELGRKAGCDETVTFDERFARLPGVRLLTG